MGLVELIARWGAVISLVGLAQYGVPYMGLCIARSKIREGDLSVDAQNPLRCFSLSSPGMGWVRGHARSRASRSVRGGYCVARSGAAGRFKLTESRR
jgi:hypothetical protein